MINTNGIVISFIFTTVVFTFNMHLVIFNLSYVLSDRLR